MNNQFKGDKFIYYYMALKLCKNGPLDNMAIIGDDNGIIGGQNFYRKFRFMPKGGHNNQAILIETKSSKSFADYSRCIEVSNLDGKIPVFRQYFNEYNENCYKWVH